LLTLVVVLFVALGVVYSLVTPIFEASDERWHYPVVKHIADGGGLPVQDPAVATPWHQEGSQPPLYYLVAAGATAWIDTSDFSQVQRPNPHAIAGLPQVIGNKNMMLHSQREAWPWRGTSLAVHLIRLLSVGMGAATVWLVWLIAGRLWPGSPAIALLAAMLVAFNPMFLFISASVNNDTLAALLGAATMLVLLRALQHGQRVRDGLWLGALLGLGALTKLSVLALLPLVAVALTWDAWRRHAWRSWLVNAAIIAAGLALIAGWWYVRNWRLYGDPTGASRMLDIVGRRDEPLTLRGLWAEFEGFRISYWALFGGVSILADRWIYPLLDALMLLASLGAVAAGLSLIPGVRKRIRSNLPTFPKGTQTGQPSNLSQRDPDGPTFQPVNLPTRLKHALQEHIAHTPKASAATYLLLVAWVVLVLASLIRWTSQTYASQGRLMFVAVAGISSLWALGLGTLTPARWRGGMAAAVGGALFLLAAVSPFRYILPAYAPPPLLTAADVPADVERVNREINGQMRLLGYRLEQSQVHPAEVLPVTVYWQALEPMDEDYSVFVHVLGRERSVVGQMNTYPGLGAWPTSRLQPGDVLADTYRVPIDAGAQAPSLLRVEVGLYRYHEPGRAGLGALDASGQPTENWLATAKLAPWDWPQATPSHPLAVRFGEAIRLAGYDLDGQELTLYWQSEGTPAADYTVFIQLWDRDHQIAGFDGQPMGGDYPTHWWAAGETIVDAHDLALSGDGERLLVGLYRLDTGERLPARHENGTPLPDFAVEIPVAP
jgi:4-amino-4-deoxy-L-arabinose transferase-like glycosyltransferase